MRNTAIKPFLTLFMVLLVSALTACSSTENSDPGPLKGKWHVTGVVDTVMTFRNGETETNHIVEKCSYQIEGKKVLVTYLSGMAKGMTQTYVFSDKDTAQSPLGIMKRIK